MTVAKGVHKCKKVADVICTSPSLGPDHVSRGVPLDAAEVVGEVGVVAKVGGSDEVVGAVLVDRVEDVLGEGARFNGKRPQVIIYSSIKHFTICFESDAYLLIWYLLSIHTG